LTPSAAGGWFAAGPNGKLSDAPSPTGRFVPLLAPPLAISVITILIIVVIVLLILGFLGRGRF
jgi:hypothetical protein